MSLGGSLRRLRLQRGLTQHDFPGVTAKTLARIERGAVTTPHAATLARIERGAVTTPHAATLAVVAKRLVVAVADLATY